MRKFFTLLLTLMVAAVALAVPAKRDIIKVTQKDGTVLTLQLIGDENMHYYLNIATGEKMFQDDAGEYYVISDSDFNSMKSKGAARMQKSNTRRTSRLAPKKVGSFSNMTGEKKGIVILVNYSDVKMDESHTQATFNNMFNEIGYSEDGHVGSVADYFKDQSYNKFNLTFDVVGPVTVSQPMAYYGQNDEYGSDMYAANMAKEACELADAQGVNFADYDWNGDGYVDQVFVIYAGYGENYTGSDTNTIWPHEWDFTSAGLGALTLDGVKINTYACTAELCGTSGTTLCGIGTACHEFSHCLGYPDSYDTDYSGGVGMSYYDVMCSGSYNGPNAHGEVPSGYTAYERWMAGWLTPVTISTQTDITNMSDLGTSSSAYIIYNNNNANEYFLLENRQSSKWFGYYAYATAGHGLFITHLDYDASVWSNNRPNDDPNHQRMTWVPADQNNTASYASDYFPGTGDVTNFTPSYWYGAGGQWFTKDNNGTYYSSLSLSNITETDGKISFSVNGNADLQPTATVTIGAAGYSTFYDSHLAYKMPTGLTGYIFDKTENKIVNTYEDGTIVPAGEALVLGGEAKSYTLNLITDATEKNENNALSGTDVETALKEDANSYFYALSLNSARDVNSVGFYWMNDTGSAFTNKAHKAYLKLSKSDNAKSGYAFNEVDAIDNVNLSPDLNANDGVCYNLTGHRVNADARGIIIQNGKKYLVK